MFIKIGDQTINTDHVQRITHHDESITLHFAGQGGELVLNDAEARSFLQQLGMDKKGGQFYPA